MDVIGLWVLFVEYHVVDYECRESVRNGTFDTDQTAFLPTETQDDRFRSFDFLCVIFLINKVRNNLPFCKSANTIKIQGDCVVFLSGHGPL